MSADRHDPVPTFAAIQEMTFEEACALRLDVRARIQDVNAQLALAAIDADPEWRSNALRYKAILERRAAALSDRIRATRPDEIEKAQARAAVIHAAAGLLATYRALQTFLEDDTHDDAATDDEVWACVDAASDHLAATLDHLEHARTPPDPKGPR